MKRVKYIGSIPLWAYLCLFGFITFYTYEIAVSADLAEYMNYGLNIFSGRGYVDMDGSPVFVRGPLFAWMLTASYWFLGVSAWSAFWVVRIFSILLPVLIYTLGKRLFNKWVGFAAGLLILTSFSMNYWSYRHLDSVWASFAILGILFMYAGLKNASFLYFVLAGLWMGLGFLIKQATVLLFPLPLVLILITKNYRNRGQLLGILSYVVTIILLISPWIIYVYTQTSSVKLAMMGIPEEAAIQSTNTLDLISFLKDFLRGLYSYYSGGSQSLVANFSLAPLFVIAWIYTLYKAIRGEKESVLLFVVMILLVPYVAYVGQNNLRVGQLLIFIAISYLVAARFMLELGKKIVDWCGIGDEVMSRFSGVVVVTGLILVQTFVAYKGDRGNIQFLQRNLFYQRIVKDNRGKDIAGYFGELSKQCGEWVEKNLPIGSSLLVSKPIEGKPIYFYSGGKYPVCVMPVIQSNLIPRGIASKWNKQIIFLSAWSAQLDPKNKLFLLTEDDLLKSIKENNIDYVVVHRKRNYLSRYFDQNGSFTKVIEFGKGAIKIYKVNEIKPIDNFAMMVSINTIDYLRALLNEDHERFLWYVGEFFEPLLNWNDKKVKALLEFSYDGIVQDAVIVRENKIYQSS